MKIAASIFKTFFLSLCIIANTHLAFAQTASILPQGKTQFLDNNGNPLTSGTVDFYTGNVSSTTRKATWQNSGETIANSNPVVLDAGGRAIIYGDGSYRQVVKDRLGNLIWDQLTSTGSSGGGGPTATGDGDLVGTIKPWAGMTTPNQYAFTYGQELNRTTYSALFTAITSTQAVFCTSGSPILTGLSDTTNFPTGAPVEVSCLAAGFSTIVSKTSSTITLAANANVNTNVNAVIFPWGNGNHITTFNLPDFRGVPIAGNNNMGGVAGSNASLTYWGVDPNSIGALGGSQSKTLLAANLPAHTHTSSTLTDPGHTHAYTLFTVFSQASGAGGGFAGTTSSGTTTTSSTGITISANTGNNASGTSTPFSIIQPIKNANYIIKITPDANSASASGVTALGGMTGSIACGSNLVCTGNIISVTLPFASGLQTTASYASLRAGAPAAIATTTFIQGRTSLTQQGSGLFTLDIADTTSTDNDGTILVDAAGNRWKRQYNGGVNVGWFDFTTANSAASNDAAIIKALSVLGTNYSGTLVFPIGTYNYNAINVDVSFGLIITSVAGGGRSGAGTGGTNLVCNSTCISIKSSFDSTIQNIELSATAAASGNYLIDASHSTASDARGLQIKNVLLDGLNSASGGAYTVNGINLLQASSAYIYDTTFLRLATGIHGQTNAAPSATNYSNNITITNSNFSGLMSYPIVNPGQNWTINGGYTQVLGSGAGFLSDGKGRVAIADTTTIWQNLIFINHSVYDTLVGGTNYLDLGPGTNLQVIGGLWGGIASSNLLIARGIISAIQISAQASNFSTIAFANVTGQLNWSFNGLNMCDNAAGTTGCSTTLIGVASGTPQSNVAGLNTDGVTPYSSQGTFAANGWRINPDGTKEVWGQVSAVAPGGTVAVTFNSAFLGACYNTQAVLVSPATASNVISLVGSCSTTAQNVFINGTGNSTVSYRAIGK